MSYTGNYNLYSEMGVGSMISRSWRLYRINFKNVILYSFIPSALIILASVIFNAPYAFSGNENIAGGIFCCLSPFGCFFYLVGIYISIFFNLGLIKAFSHIIRGKPYSYTYVFNSMKKNIANSLLMSLFFISEIIFFSIINIFLLIICYILILVPIIAFAAMKSSINNELYESITCLLIFIIVIIAIIICISILAVQFIFISMQFVCYGIEKTTFIMAIMRSVAIIIKQPGKTILFGICIGGLYVIINMYFQYPTMLVLAMISVAIEPLSKELAVFMIMISINTWSHLVNLLMWPFLISSVVIFYYDTLIKTEGLDLKLLIKKEQEKIPLKEP